MPGRGKFRGGRLQKQIGPRGPLGLGLPLTISIPMIVNGNTHFQHTSVRGFTNRPTQFAWTGSENLTKRRIMDSPFMNMSTLLSPLNLMTVLAGVLVFVAAVCRSVPSIPEPEYPLLTPFGKVPFFDGVVVYSLFVLLFLFKIRLIEYLL